MMLKRLSLKQFLEVDTSAVVRRISDWKHQWTVPTDPNDGYLATEGLEKEWLHPDFNHNVLACLHIKGSEAGRIEVWDIPSTTLKHTWSHQNVTKGVWAGDTLCTFSEVDGVVNTWQCGFEGKRSQSTMEGRSRMECLGWRILQFQAVTGRLLNSTTA